jgi:ribosomal protein S18 acetylase RimI-like enzyme
VLPGYQGQGVGSALLAVAQNASATLQLWTFQSNAGARRFYEGRGFIAVEQTDGSGNEEHEPDVRYRWDRSAHQHSASE